MKKGIRQIITLGLAATVSITSSFATYAAHFQMDIQKNMNKQSQEHGLLKPVIIIT